MAIYSLLDLINRVYDRLDGNSVLYTQAEVIDAINESARVTNLLTGYNQGSVPFPYPSQPNAIWYDTPPGVLITTRIQFEGRYLQPSNVNNIGKSHPQWASATTANTGSPVTTWLRFGLNKFGLWPADALGGGQIVVSGILEPAKLVNLTDTIAWSSDIINCFDLYASHILQLKESDGIFSAASLDYVGWQRIIKKLTVETGWRMPRYWVDQAQQTTGR